MKQTPIIAILVLLIALSCQKDKKAKKEMRNFEERIATREYNLVKFASSVEFNKYLQKPKSTFVIFPDLTQDTLIAICNCQKNIKDNTIKIQISKEFPSKSNINQNGFSDRLIYFENIAKQRTYITFELKDSILEKIEIHRKSQEPQFNGEFKKTYAINNYHISLTKNNYKTAQDIWGNFKLILPLDFGIFPKDTLLVGSFYCNNWKIDNYYEFNEYPKSKKVEINKSLDFPQSRNKNGGIDLFDSDKSWECECSMNKTKDTLIVKNKNGDGESGDKLTIKITNDLKPEFIFEKWNDLPPFHEDYSFNTFTLELNKNPFETDINNFIGKYCLSTDIIPELYGDRLIKKGKFICR